MTDPVDSLPLPPGSYGLPLLGKTLAIAADMTNFLLEGGKQHGDIWKANVFFRKVAFVSGPEAATLFLDPEKVDRAGGHPAHVRELFGGTNINMYNGPRHAALKKLLLTGFSREAFEAYLPDIDALMTASLEATRTAGRSSWADALRKLAIEIICKNVLGLSPGAQTEEIRADYAAVLAGMTAIPVPLPGTTFTRAKAARDRLLARFRTLITEHRATPREDGLSRIIAATLPDGTRIEDDALVLELHHTVIAGYIVFGILMSLGWQLHDQPDLLARARAEVEAAGRSGDLKTLFNLPFCMQLVLEAVKRCAARPKRSGPIRSARLATPMRSRSSRCA